MKAVTNHNDALPVLIPVPVGEKHDGDVYLEGAWRAVRVIRFPPDAKPSAQKIMKRFSQRFGGVSREDVVEALRLLVLSQAVGKETPTKRYAILKRSYLPLAVHTRLARGDPDGKDEIEEQTWNDLLPPGGSMVERLCAAVNQYLQAARPVVWWNEHHRRLDVGLLCDTARDALFATNLVRFAMPEGIGFCMNEKCGQMFVRHRRKHWYCCETCGSYFRKMKQRGKLTSAESMQAPDSDESRTNA